MIPCLKPHWILLFSILTLLHMPANGQSKKKQIVSLNVTIDSLENALSQSKGKILSHEQQMNDNESKSEKEINSLKAELQELKGNLQEQQAQLQQTKEAKGVLEGSLSQHINEHKQQEKQLNQKIKALNIALEETQKIQLKLVDSIIYLNKQIEISQNILKEEKAKKDGTLSSQNLFTPLHWSETYCEYAQAQKEAFRRGEIETVNEWDTTTCQRTDINLFRLQENSNLADKIEKITLKWININQGIELSSFDDIQEWLMSLHNNEYGGYDLEIWSQIDCQNDEFIQFSIYEVSGGGAHDLHSSMTYILDKESGGQLSIIDLLLPNKKSEFLKIACDKFFDERKDLEEDNSLYFERNSFYLPDDFGISSDGAEFCYQEYEIGPYSIGPARFFNIPLDVCRNYFKTSVIDLMESLKNNE